MTQLTAEVVSQIFALPANERSELAQKLWESVDDHGLTAEWDHALGTELDRRMDRYHRGESTAIEWNDAAEEALRAEVNRRLGK